MIKITEFWLNIITGTFFLLLLFYVIRLGWKSNQFTNILLVVLGFFIVTILIILIPRKPSEKEIALKEKYPYSDALLLTCIRSCQLSNGADLKCILEIGDFINKGIFTFDELMASKNNLLSIGMVRLDKKKFYLTEKFHHYLYESLINKKNPWIQTERIHALLNALNLAKQSQVIQETDSFSQEDYDAALSEYSKKAKQVFEKMKLK